MNLYRPRPKHSCLVHLTYNYLANIREYGAEEEEERERRKRGLWVVNCIGSTMSSRESDCKEKMEIVERSTQRAAQSGQWKGERCITWLNYIWGSKHLRKGRRRFDGMENDEKILTGNLYSEQSFFTTDRQLIYNKACDARMQKRSPFIRALLFTRSNACWSLSSLTSLLLGHDRTFSWNSTSHLMISRRNRGSIASSARPSILAMQMRRDRKPNSDVSALLRLLFQHRFWFINNGQGRKMLARSGIFLDCKDIATGKTKHRRFINQQGGCGRRRRGISTNRSNKGNGERTYITLQ